MNSIDINTILAGGGVRVMHDAGTAQLGGAPTSADRPRLSVEQQRIIDAAVAGRNVIVDAVPGSGKTTTIQIMCEELQKAAQARGETLSILYLTYSKMLKADAQRRVRGARVQNYHGVVYPSLREANIRCGIGESIAQFNANFDDLSHTFPRYDVIIIDEYQDIIEEYRDLLVNIRSLNEIMQVVMVGDIDQKVKSNTALDVQAFAKSFAENAELLPLTRSFRLGPEITSRLSRAWDKPIIGVNAEQQIRVMGESEVVSYMATLQPKDLLCMGKRDRGGLTRALNALEREAGERFNKNTVYASIRQSEDRATYTEDTAVFTTYDSTKGMERRVAVVFDFDEAYWNIRARQSDTDMQVLRNIFLVAASRGKEEIIFVRSSNANTDQRIEQGEVLEEDLIGDIDIETFQTLEDHHNGYRHPFEPSSCFDFKYAEDVADCMRSLHLTQLSGVGEELSTPGRDGFIDLSPVIGEYQEAVFFPEFNAKLVYDNYVDAAKAGQHAPPSDSVHDVFLGRLRGRDGYMVDDAGKFVRDENNDKIWLGRDARTAETDSWRQCLALSAMKVGHDRYIDQVDIRPSAEFEQALIARLAEHLDPEKVASQVSVEMAGNALGAGGAADEVDFAGVADAVQVDGEGQEVVYELKFTMELSYAMFLQLALYMVMLDLPYGVLWNVRTGERWGVEIRDRALFMNRVIACVTKRRYRVFRPIAD